MSRSDAPTTRPQSLIPKLRKANERLKEAIRLEPTQIHKDAAIQRFEFTIELAWKTLQAVLRFLGEEALSPRDAIRIGARTDLVSDPEQWFRLITARNLTSHTYDESIADKVYAQAKTLPDLVDDMVEKITTRIE